MFNIFFIVLLLICTALFIIFLIADRRRFKFDGSKTPDKVSSYAGIFLLLLLSVSIVVITYLVSETPGIVIQEVCSNNFSAFENAAGKHPDYIELYNSGTRDISLEGWTLSTENELSEPYTFGAVTLKPEACLLLLNSAAKKNHTDEMTELHVVPSGDTLQLEIPCAVSKKGETIYLRNTMGKTIDAVKVPALTIDTAFARNAKSSEWNYATPTPGVDNALGTTLSPEDVFSMQGPPAYTADQLSNGQADAGDFPVLSISMTDYDRNGPRGIFLPDNLPENGRTSERACQIDYFSPGLIHDTTQLAGIRVSGRTDNLTHLDFNLYARDNYDDKTVFDYDFLSTDADHEKLNLKYDSAKEYLLTKLLEKNGFPVPASAPCLVYLNGEYYGEYSLSEPWDDTFLSDSYKMKPGDLTVLRDQQLSSGSEYALLEYRKLVKTVTSLDLSQKENYDLFCDEINIDSLIDYYAFQAYFNNYGITPYHNSVIWRSESVDSNNPYADGKWHFEIAGLDETLENEHLGFQPTTNTFYHILLEDFFFSALLQNDDFYEALSDRINSLSKTAFSEKNIGDFLSETKSLSGSRGTVRSDLTAFFKKRSSLMPQYVKELRG